MQIFNNCFRTENEAIEARDKVREVLKGEVADKYNELIMAVGNKHEGETRHETALRYIRQAERSSSSVERN